MIQFFLSLHAFSDWGLLALRIALGATFIVHGRMKKGMWNMQPSAQMPSGMLNLMRFLSIVEPLGGLAVLVGFLTQPASLGLAIIMIGAIKLKTMKWKTPFASLEKNGWELDLILLAAALMVFFSGAGSFGLDRMIFAS